MENVIMEEPAKQPRQEPNVYLYHMGGRSVTITSGEVWYKRLWYLFTNPLYYIFAGRWRF